MDWIMLSVEGLGLLILCVWVVVPIREFAEIARRIVPKSTPRLVEPSKNTPTPFVENLP